MIIYNNFFLANITWWLGPQVGAEVRVGHGPRAKRQMSGTSSEPPDCKIDKHRPCVLLPCSSCAQVQSYLDAVDASRGYYLWRWGDAPVHTMVVRMFLTREQVRAGAEGRQQGSCCGVPCGVATELRTGRQGRSWSKKHCD